MSRTRCKNWNWFWIPNHISKRTFQQLVFENNPHSAKIEEQDESFGNYLAFQHFGKILMKHLWSPWRMRYITDFKKDGCVFCDVLEQEDTPANLIVYRGEKAYVILNAYPYTSGHLMVLPYQHVPDLIDLDPETRAEMMELVTKTSQVLRSLYSPEGFNIGINMGEAAGAGIEEHLHIHIVPRWIGDTNFMTAVGQTRVLPEALDETYRQIKDAW